jgi:hypothetical protein
VGVGGFSLVEKSYMAFCGFLQEMALIGLRCKERKEGSYSNIKEGSSGLSSSVVEP